MAQIEGHALKFVLKGKTLRNDVGVRAFPHQTYGVSEESPDFFRAGHSLIGKNGYIYKHDQAKGYAYLSQKKYLNCHDHSPQNIELEPYLASRDIREAHARTQLHRKKGRLSEFMDKNAWMAGIRPMMGHERNAEGRQLSNKAREQRVKSINARINFENKVLIHPRTDPKYHETISTLMGEKFKIRSKRNSLAQQQIPATARTIEIGRLDLLTIESMTDKMAKTTQEWHWSPRKGRSTELSATKHSTLLPQTARNDFEDRQQLKGGKLEDWYRTACSSKKWTYHPKQSQEEEDESMFA